ncbi:hypothetical protein DFJ74DRAFT_688259 [Hyaloraphidium curvatum]|nr:hypothetical protein DFJ74DRAFT_688259 [Hyaloraphidium curvatum]
MLLRSSSAKRSLHGAAVAAPAPAPARGKRAKLQSAPETPPLDNSPSNAPTPSADPVERVEPSGSGAADVPLLDLGPLTPAMILRRPSTAIKTPYVADVVVLDGTVPFPFPVPQVEGTAKAKQAAMQAALDALRSKHGTKLAHAPALDCAGIVVPGSRVWCTPSSESSQTDLAVQLCEEAREDGSWSTVGYHPSLAEKMCEEMLARGSLAPYLGEHTEVGSQKTFGKSRVDYVLLHKDGSRTLLEVKNAVGADYPAGLVPATRSPVGVYVRPAEGFRRSSIFPHGSKKPGIGVVSDRAIKHVHELGELHGTKVEEKEVRCAVLFVVNRSDCEAFRPCHEADMLFAQCLLRAKNKGVTLIAVAVRWEGGKAFMDKVLPVEFDASVREEDLDADLLARVLKFNEEGGGKRR